MTGHHGTRHDAEPPEVPRPGRLLLIPKELAPSPELAPSEPISGRAAYDRYAAHTLPFLTALGGEVQFIGEGGPYLIGPPEERWDVVMLVRHASVEAFMGMADNIGYLAGLGHRTAALEDSRLLPIVGQP